jgi:hypothetical protein
MDVEAPPSRANMLRVLGGCRRRTVRRSLGFRACRHAVMLHRDLAWRQPKVRDLPDQTRITDPALTKTTDHPNTKVTTSFEFVTLCRQFIEPLVVGEGGLEPPRPEGHWHLKPARLPFRHSPQQPGKTITHTGPLPNRVDGAGRSRGAASDLPRSDSQSSVGPVATYMADTMKAASRLRDTRGLVQTGNDDDRGGR